MYVFGAFALLLILLGLVLHFVSSNAHIPWLGKLEELKLTKKQIPSHHAAWEAYPASYYTKKTDPEVPPIPSIAADALQADCQKVIRCIKQLPGQQETILAEYVSSAILISSHLSL